MRRRAIPLRTFAAGLVRPWPSFKASRSSRKRLRPRVSGGAVSQASIRCCPSHQSLDWLLTADARSQLILCGNFIIFLFLQQPRSLDLQSAWSLVQTLRSSLHRLESQADDVAKLLIRPVLLRIESLFSQGPELIRQYHSARVATSSAQGDQRPRHKASRLMI